MIENNAALPREILEVGEEFLQLYGLDGLDAAVKMSFLADVYPRYLEKTEDIPQLWTPYNDMQRRAIASDALELFCGGKAGTGKSDVLLGYGIMHSFNGIIFRQEYSQMDELEERSREILLGTGATYNASPTSKRWRGIPGGRRLRFGAIKYDADIGKYQGRARDFIGFDEITHFKEKHYRILFTWVRSQKNRVRIICTGNPPDPAKPEQMWVKRRWAAWVDNTHPNPAAPGELRWYVNVDGKDTEVEGPDVEIRDSKGIKLKPISRTFIPGEMLDFYKDNEYESMLQTLPEPYRSQYLFGDFTAEVRDQERQVIPTESVILAEERWESQSSPSDAALSSVGVDVARGGENQTIISKRYDNWFAELLKFKGEETKDGWELGEVVIEAIGDELQDDLPLIFDLGGVGTSPYDIFRDAGFKVDGFNGASKSKFRDKSKRLKFVNRRAEAWWKFREALDPNSGEDIALPPDPELRSDLTAPRWELTAQGIKIEKKEDIQKRLGRSPDCGDAVVMNYNSISRGETLYF